MEKLVLIPGMMSDECLWKPQVEALQGIYDISVFFYPDKDDVQDMAAAILKSIEGSFAVCGTSMGGYVALEVAIMAPERVTHLGLFNTGASGDTEERKQQRQEELDKGEEFFICVRSTDEYFKTFLSPAKDINSDVIELMRATALDLGYRTLINHHTACMNRPRRLDDLGVLQMPVTLLSGRDDEVTPLTLQQDIATLVPHTDWIVLDDCGHIASLEQPEKVTQALRNLMAKGKNEERKRA